MRSAIESRIRKVLRAEYVKVLDESHHHVGHAGAKGQGGHYRAVVVADQFGGLSRIEAQRLVYAALREWMGREIHAISMQTFTPEGWRASSSAEE